MMVMAGPIQGIPRAWWKVQPQAAVAMNDQSMTNMGDITFATGSILASGATNGNTLLLRANDTTFITFTTGATDVCTIASPTFSGTALASGTFTMPNFTFGAVTILPASGIIKGTALQPYYIIGGADTSNDSYITFYALGHANTGRIQVFTYNGTTAASRLTLSGGTATAVATWAAITHAGMILSDALTFTGTNYSIVRDDHTNYLILTGGTSDLFSAYWTMYGKNHSTLPGYAALTVPNAAKTGRLVALQVSGATDNPAITWLDAARHSSMNFASAAVLAGIGTGASGIKIKNPKNAAASALSGTQLDVEIDIGGTPYYFTVYPTKA